MPSFLRLAFEYATIYNIVTMLSLIDVYIYKVHYKVIKSEIIKFEFRD